jgi:hypothetical protein
MIASSSYGRNPRLQELLWEKRRVTTALRLHPTLVALAHAADHPFRPQTGRPSPDNPAQDQPALRSLPELLAKYEAIPCRGTAIALTLPSLQVLTFSCLAVLQEWRMHNQELWEQPLQAPSCLLSTASRIRTTSMERFSSLATCQSGLRAGFDCSSTSTRCATLNASTFNQFSRIHSLSTRRSPFLV